MIARVGPVGAILVGTLVLAAAAAWALARPRADRDWAPEQATPPEITFEGDTVRVRRLRDFRYTPDGSALPGFRDEAFPLDDVRRVWFALAPFARRYRGLAHSFVTFEFAGGRFVAVSVEARREDDERYSLLGGLLRSYELAYVVGTEQDLLGVRAQRGDTIFLYPSVTTPAQARAIFLDVMKRARDTQERPEFYNTLVNNCNTNLRRHVNGATSAGLPWGWGILLPGFSDSLALERGLLDTTLSLERAREWFRVDKHVRQALAEGAADFSLRIRAREGA